MKEKKLGRQSLSASKNLKEHALREWSPQRWRSCLREGQSRVEIKSEEGIRMIKERKTILGVARKPCPRLKI